MGEPLSERMPHEPGCPAYLTRPLADRLYEASQALPTTAEEWQEHAYLLAEAAQVTEAMNDRISEMETVLRQAREDRRIETNLRVVATESLALDATFRERVERLASQHGSPDNEEAVDGLARILAQREGEVERLRTVVEAARIVAGPARIWREEDSWYLVEPRAMGTLTAALRDIPEEGACAFCSWPLTACQPLWTEQRKCCPDCSHGDREEGKP